MARDLLSSAGIRKGKGWKTIIDDVRKSYRLQGGQIVETTI